MKEFSEGRKKNIRVVKHLISVIKEIRIKKKMTTKQMADLLGFKEGNYRSFEANRSRLDVYELYLIAKVLKVDLNSLVEDALFEDKIQLDSFLKQKELEFNDGVTKKEIDGHDFLITNNGGICHHPDCSSCLRG
jgi:transcriptional regulator with XRE-family HTH domain